MNEHIVMKQAEESESDFLVYTGTFCGYCTAAKRLLTSKGLSFDEINLPFRKILPEFNFCKPAKVLRIVVFPIPEGPNKEIISP